MAGERRGRAGGAGGGSGRSSLAGRGGALRCQPKAAVFRRDAMRACRSRPFQMDLLSLRIVAWKRLGVEPERGSRVWGWRQQAEGWGMLVGILFSSELGCENANE